MGEILLIFWKSLVFHNYNYEGYEEEQANIRQLVESIPREPDHGLDILSVDGDDEELVLSI